MYMKIVVFGANGKIGSLIVKRLLADGHTVRAFVHSNSTLKEHKNLEIVQGDVHDAGQVSAALEGYEIVISALGSWGTASKDILSSAMLSIIPVMQRKSMKRIISLTGSGARDSQDSLTLMERLSRGLILLAAHKILEDGEKHLALLRESNLDWTVVRSPGMRNGSSSSYVFSRKSPAPWATITRNAVAISMVDQINDTAWIQAAPHIRSK